MFYFSLLEISLDVSVFKRFVLFMKSTNDINLQEKDCSLEAREEIQEEEVTETAETQLNTENMNDDKKSQTYSPNKQVNYG